MPASGWSKLVYANTQDHTALSAWTTEASLLAAAANFDQPAIPSGTFLGPQAYGKSFLLIAAGHMLTTGTPAFTWRWRLSTTAGSASLSTPILGVTAAITTQTVATGTPWETHMRITCTKPGSGSGNATLNCNGWVTSPQGFASPFNYPMLPTTPPATAWTVTLDGSLTYYVNLSVASGADAGNGCTCKRLWMFDEN